MLEERSEKIIIGVGNELLGDDGAGSALCREGVFGFYCIDAGTLPENFTGVIRKNRPDIVVIVDAACMGINPGEVRIIPHERINETGTGTHKISLNHFISFIKPFTGDVILIGIEPLAMEYGSELSPPVILAVQYIRECLLGGIKTIKNIEVFQNEK